MDSRTTVLTFGSVDACPEKAVGIVKSRRQIAIDGVANTASDRLKVSRGLAGQGIYVFRPAVIPECKELKLILDSSFWEAADQANGWSSKLTVQHQPAI